jgi:hypothetical protein
VNRIKNQAVGSVRAILADWRKRYENNLPPSDEKRHEIIDNVVTSLGPLFVLPLAALEARDSHLGADLLLADLLDVPDWDDSGFEPIFNFPSTLGFIFHYLFGSKSIAAGQPERVFDLLTKTRITLNSEKGPKSVWEREEVMVYAATIGNSVDSPWKYIKDASYRMGWLQRVFGGTDNYRQAVVAYSIALNIFELATLIAANQGALVSDSDYKWLPRIPPYFYLAEPGDRKHASNLLTKDGRVLETCWTYLGVSLDDVKRYWKPWMNKVQSYWTNWFPRLGIHPTPHKDILP